MTNDPLIQQNARNIINLDVKIEYLKKRVDHLIDRFEEHIKLKDAHQEPFGGLK